MMTYRTLEADDLYSIESNVSGVPYDGTARSRQLLREGMKRRGRQMMADPTMTTEAKVRAYTMVLTSHWLRSVEAAEFNLYHPTRNEYIRLCETPRGYVDDGVWLAFVRKWRPVSHPKMKAGTSYFEV